MEQAYILYQINREKDRENKFDSNKIMKFRDLPKGMQEVNLSENFYEQVHRGDIEVEENRLFDALEKLFHKYNMNHPIDFKGHSMSVSDIIKLGENYYYCSSIGFDKITVIE